MQIIEVVPGSDEWKALRTQYDTASEAPAMMGASSKVKRSDLVRMKATGDEKEFSRWVEEVLFERGHEVERNGRPMAEEVIGSELYPATCVDDAGEMLCSLDGITMDEAVIWECKQWNEAKAADVRAGCIPQEDKWQVVQQLVITGADYCLYTVTDGTPDRSETLRYELDPADASALRAGWAQLRKDVADYVPEAAEVIVEGNAPESLPALRIEVAGRVVASNLDMFRDRAFQVIDSINTDLQTDEDFADAEKAVKWCGEVEKRLAAAKDAAQAQAEDIDALFRTVDEIREQARSKRLTLDKLVKAQKEQRRGEILATARDALRTHIDQIEKALGGKIRMPEIGADFAGVMKGKKTIASLKDATSTELARAKILANEIANGIRVNLELLRTEAKGFESLFHDAQHLVTTKTEEDLRNLVKARISEHQAAEAEKIRQAEEAGAERARAEERARQTSERPAAEAIAPAIQQGATASASRPAAPPGSTARVTRPTNDQIVDAVSAAFHVDAATARGWLLAFTTTAAA